MLLFCISMFRYTEQLICLKMQNKTSVFWIKEAWNEFVTKIASYKIKENKWKVINVLIIAYDY